MSVSPVRARPLTTSTGSEESSGNGPAVPGSPSRDFRSESSNVAKHYYRDGQLSTRASVAAGAALKEADRIAMEKRMARDLASAQEKILGSYMAHHAASNAAGAGGMIAPQQEIKENYSASSPTGGRRSLHAFSSPLSQDYSDLAPESLSLRSPYSPTHNSQRHTRQSRCIIAGCSQEPVGGRGFCTTHAAATSNGIEPPQGGVRVVTRGGSRDNLRRDSSPSRGLPTVNFITSSLAPSPLQASLAAASIGLATPLFPSIQLSPSQSHTRTQIIQAQYGKQHEEAAGSNNTTSANGARSSKGAEEINYFLSNASATAANSGAAALSVSNASPLRLSSNRHSMPQAYASSEETNRVLTPRTALSRSISGRTTLNPAPPAVAGSSTAPQPVRSLRTPAGLALSYEHGRNIKGLRKEVLYKAQQPAGAPGQQQQQQQQQGSPASSPKFGAQAAAALGTPAIISHVHQSPLQSLHVNNSTISSLNQTSLTANLNRTSTLNGGASISDNLSSNNHHQRAPSPTQQQQQRIAAGGGANAAAAIAVPPRPTWAPHDASAAGSATDPANAHNNPQNTVAASPLVVLASQGEKPMTAVQRQRAYRAALLSKALLKPVAVASLDRSRLDNLKALLGKRSSFIQLLKRKIVVGEEDAAKEAASKQQQKNNLAHFFQARPSADALAHKNILKSDEDVVSKQEKKNALGAFFARRPSALEVEKKLGVHAGQKKALLGILSSELPIDEEKEAGGSGSSTARSRKNVDPATEVDPEVADEVGDTIAEDTAHTPRERFKKFPGALKAQSLPVRRLSKVDPKGRKFSVFTSVKMATNAENTLNKLSNFLENRPHFEELLKKNIMMTKPGSHFHSNPTLAANARKMSFSNLRNNVSKLLATRPTMKDLKSMAKNLLGSMVKNQMDSIKESEANEKERQDALIAEHHAKAAVDDRSASPSSAAAAGSNISLEALSSGNFKIDEIFAERRRLAEQKLRQKEEEDIGGVYMMGSNEHGQTGFLGDQEFIATLSHLKPLLRETVVQVVCGYQHTLIRTHTGGCYVFGKNSYGQLGLGDTQDRDQPYSIQFRGSPLFKKFCNFIAAHEKASAVVTKDGEVFTFGSIACGALGHGDPNSSDPGQALAPMPVSLPELRNKSIQRISLGATHGAALDKSGKMYTWGRNEFGQRGNNDYKDNFRPTLISTYGEFWADVTCGEYHTGAIGFDNNVYLWGCNRNGQLGFQTNSPDWNSPSPAPKIVMSLFRKGVHKISLGRHHTVAVTEEGEAYSTIIIDSLKMIEKCKFHRMKPKLHLKDLIATPIDNTMGIDLQGLLYIWEPNSLDEPRMDDTLETRHLGEISAGLEHFGIVGTIDKKWRTQAEQQHQAAVAAAKSKASRDDDY